MSTAARVPDDTAVRIDRRRDPELNGMPTENDLPYDDGEPMESDWHREAGGLLVEVCKLLSQPRDDWYCAGNMFIYFSLEMVKNKDFRGPDFFFVKGVAKRSRKSYVVWDEGLHYPNVIVEIASDSTRDVDYAEKKDIYERTFQTPEYFIVEPDRETIRGWRLVAGKYKAIAVVDGKLRCEQLGIDFGWWVGNYRSSIDRYPRFFYSDGRLAPTFAEAERQKAEAERQKAEAATNKLFEAEARNAALLAELAAFRAAQKSQPE